VTRSTALAGLLSALLLACSDAREQQGAPGGVHPAGIAEPRSENFHGTSLRARHWSPMLDKNDDEACGRCHDGVASQPDGVRFAAPGTPSCTSCHKEGILGCTTCHGDGKVTGSHGKHVVDVGLACTTCHQLPGAAVIGGTHGNGVVDLVFDPTRVAPGASYDRASGACTVSCHDHGGARARPAWGSTGPLQCGDCHKAPPADHYPGLCSTCHHEANDDGSALAPGPFHLNGKVDLGDGSGGCAACHGNTTGGWPSSGAHPSHRLPTQGAPVSCASCHPAYDSPQSPGHLDGQIHVAFGDRARDRGAEPTWDGASCDSVACHGAGLAEQPLVVPAWQDTSGVAIQCGSCHGIPPKQHTPSPDCGRADCHGGEVKRALGVLSISPAGRALHINGKIEKNR